MSLTEVFDSGYFTSTGVAVNIPLRFDPDFMEVLNYTQMATTQNPGRNVKSEWQRGMASATGISYTKTNSSNALNGDDMTANGFTLVNTSVRTPGASVAFTAITDADPPVVSTGDTSGVIAGDVVRIFTSAASGSYQIAGMDFTIGTIVANTSFELSYMGAPGDAAPGSGTFRRIPFDPIYYPRERYIVNITQATSAVVTLSVTHGYVVGQKLQFFVPAAYGMTQMNGLIGEVTAIDTTNNTVTVNIDSSGFTAYAFPRASAVPFVFAMACPCGEIPTIVTQANENQAILGMRLGTTVVGGNNDLIYYRAWKAFRYSSGTIPSA